MALMTKRRNRAMPDFKPREEWDAEHEVRVRKLLGKKACPGGGVDPAQQGIHPERWVERARSLVGEPASSPRERITFQSIMAYLRVAPRIPTSPMTALVAGIVAPVAPLPAPLSVTEVRIHRIIVARYQNPVPDNFPVRAVCMWTAPQFLFQCGFGSCGALIRWNPFGERDGRCPGCGAFVEAHIQQMRADGAFRMVAVIGNGDIPWL